MVVGGAWQGRRVFVTGHTGFVGGWLSLWLSRLGAKVHGYSLAPPTTPSFYETTRLRERLASDVRGDIRDGAAVKAAMARANPEIVFHLAAQPIVREAHRDPVATFSTNVMGTVEVLEACRACDAVRGIVAYTTDKVYRNDQSGRAFEEGDRLGGNEPYSASKAACDWAVGAYWESYLRGKGVGAAIVRAGNLIGGGDWARERLVPDAARAFSQRRALVVRNPAATRPWQHVLDAVRGTLLLAQQLEATNMAAEEIAWNLGPSPAGEVSVGGIADLAVRAWGDGAAWRHEPDAHIPEAKLLRLSSEKAKRRLGWECAWDTERSVRESIAWYKAAGEGADLASLSERQVDAHTADAGRGP